MSLPTGVLGWEAGPASLCDTEQGPGVDEAATGLSLEEQALSSDLLGTGSATLCKQSPLSSGEEGREGACAEL